MKILDDIQQELWVKWGLRLLALASICFVFSKLSNTETIEEISKIYYELNAYSIVEILVLGVTFSFANWMLETQKWKLVFGLLELHPFTKLLRLNYATYALSYATPARVAVYPLLTIVFKGFSKSQVWQKKFFCDFSQQTTTWLFAAIGSCFVGELDFYKAGLLQLVLPFGAMTYLGLLFIKNISKGIGRLIKKWDFQIEEMKSSLKFEILLMSILRYLVFTALFMSLITIFKVASFNIETFARVTVYFWLASFIPRFFMSDLLGRQSVAILIFPDAISAVVIVVFLQWIFNSFLPVIIGLFISRNLKLI